MYFYRFFGTFPYTDWNTDNLEENADFGGVIVCFSEAVTLDVDSALPAED